MNSINKAFEGSALVAVIVAGDPSLAASEENILRAAEAGAGIIEIGIPFSDPSAESPVMQAAYLRALENGTKIDGIFEMTARVRRKTDVPLAFLSYLNPIYCYGYEAFFARCAAVGVGGVIVPDLPFEELGELRGITAKHGVTLIRIVAPAAAPRIAQVIAGAEDFLCLTGILDAAPSAGELPASLVETMRHVRQATALPAVVSFNIESAAQARLAAQLAGGVVIDGPIAALSEQYGEAAGPKIAAYVAELKAAMQA